MGHWHQPHPLHFVWAFLLGGLLRLYHRALLSGAGPVLRRLLLGSLVVDGVSCWLFCRLWVLGLPYVAGVIVSWFLSQAACFPLRAVVRRFAVREVAHGGWARPLRSSWAAERRSSQSDDETEPLRVASTGLPVHAPSELSGVRYLRDAALALSFASVSSGFVVAAACLFLKYELEERGAVADVPPYAWLIGDCQQKHPRFQLNVHHRKKDRREERTTVLQL